MEKQVILKGKIGWPRLWKPTSYKGVEKWSCQFYPDDINEMIKLGLNLKPKVNDDPNHNVPTGTYYNLTRKVLRKKYGKDVEQSPPIIYNADGTVCDTFFANGSGVEVTITVYAYKDTVGHILECVRVTNPVAMPEREESTPTVTSDRKMPF